MAVKKLKNYSCPFCGGTDFVKGRISEDVYNFQRIIPLKTHAFRIRDQIEIRVYCKNCGSLVRTYIQHPEMLENNQE